MKRGGPWRRGGPPPWWPEGASWPPEGRDIPRLRRRFLLVVAAALGTLFLLVFLAGIVATTVFNHGGWNNERGYDGPPPFIGLLVLGLGIFFVVRFLRRTAAPIGDVMEAAQRVAQGDYAVRVEPRGSGATRELGVAFNAMAERLAVNEGQRRRLLADVTHELRTPLSIIRGNVEGMLDGLYPRDDEHLAPVLEETAQMARLLNDLHTLATAEAGALDLHREPADLPAFVADVVAAFTPRAEVAGVRLASSVEAGPEVEFDPVRIRQVLENLLSNALRYTPAGGTIAVTGERAGDAIRLAVIDSGRGVPAEALPRIFDRFAKSADSGGSGLGLAIARSLVEAHGGTIAASATPGGGLTVTVTLPI